MCGELANTLVLSATMVRHVVMHKVIRPGTLNEIKLLIFNIAFFFPETDLIHGNEE